MRALTAAGRAAEAAEGRRGATASTGAPLTARRRELLRFISGRVAAGERPPSYAEMLAHLGLTGPNAVAGHLRAMRRDGWLTWDGGKRRTLRVAGLAGGLTWRGRTVPVCDATPAGVRLMDVLRGGANS